MRLGRAAVLAAVPVTVLVTSTGSAVEPVTSSVSGDHDRFLACDAWLLTSGDPSIDIHSRPSGFAVVVTHFVTQSPPPEGNCQPLCARGTSRTILLAGLGIS